MATRSGSAEWLGDLKEGNGKLTVGDGVFEGNYSFASRFEEGPGTNPEELIAAAHAACFSMALSGALGRHGHPPESIKTSARVFLRNVDGAQTLQRIELETEGRVPGIDQDHFAAHAEEAKAACPVSRALAGVPEIEVTARLAG
ncbi:MAG TPA: OsmC family peroxiredoxin [Solirubrobacterales bacterium]|jgi:osmotically inducible protein OsmC|nr:OsmC family peroxiredoxin [Solirubrobacterales bacterium]